MAFPEAAIFGIGSKLIEKHFPDPDKRAEAEARLYEMHQAGELKELEAAASIITAEAKSEHWITSAWRPITMLTFVAIIANNYLIYPYLALFWDSAPMLEIPENMWELIKIGIGGYVVSRGVERGIENWKK